MRWVRVRATMAGRPRRLTRAAAARSDRGGADKSRPGRSEGTDAGVLTAPLSCLTVSIRCIRSRASRQSFLQRPPKERTAQCRAGQGRAGQGRAGQGRAGQGRARRTEQLKHCTRIAERTADGGASPLNIFVQTPLIVQIPRCSVCSPRHPLATQQCGWSCDTPSVMRWSIRPA